MPTYELPKNKLYDILLQVPEEWAHKFLEKLKDINESAWKNLIDNPHGMVKKEDSFNPYPNATFTKAGYKFWIRRNQYLTTDSYYDAMDAITRETDIACYGLKIFEHPFYGKCDSLCDGWPDKIEFGVTYNILFDLGYDNCEFKENIQDYTELSPDTTPELINSLLSVRQEGEREPKGTIFASLEFSLDKNLVDELQNDLPEDMSDYIKNKAAFHAIYHDNDDNLDGCQAFILLNVPLDPTEDPSSYEVDYNDSEVPMGNRFINFLNAHQDEWEGNFAVYMIPQPGILKPERYKNVVFSTSWKIIDWFSFDQNSLIALRWGNEEYFRDDPFHMYPQCYLYVDPKIIAEGSKNESANLSDSENDEDSEELRAKAEEWVRKAKNSKWGKINEDTFREYLIGRGFKELTDSGKPSTVPQYVKSITFVGSEEGLDWNGVAENIDRLIEEYDDNGSKAALGAKGHDTVINSLKRFREFLNFLENPEQ